MGNYIINVRLEKSYTQFNLSLEMPLVAKNKLPRGAKY